MPSSTSSDKRRVCLSQSLNFGLRRSQKVEFVECKSLFTLLHFLYREYMRFIHPFGPWNKIAMIETTSKI